MTDPDPPRRVRWDVVALGACLATSGTLAGWGLGRGVFRGAPRTTGLGVLLALLVFGVLGWSIVLGVRLVAFGVGGAQRAPARTYRAARFALLATGLSTAGVLVVSLLSPGRVDAQDVFWWMVLPIWAGASFWLARGMRRLETGTGGPAWMQLPAAFGAATLPLFLLIGLLLIYLFVPSRHTKVPPNRYEATNNARNLAIILSERAPRRGWPPYGGKNFVLALAARRLIDIRNPDNLEVFFCRHPDDERPRSTQEDYEDVTIDTLARRRFPHLTDFAGRRNDEPAYRLADDAHEKSEPILGARVGEHVVVGFSDGAARLLDRDALGLQPGDPIVFGEESTSPLLRPLSDR